MYETMSYTYKRSCPLANIAGSLIEVHCNEVRIPAVMINDTPFFSDNDWIPCRET